MTCIVGLVGEDGRVYIGGDSAGVAGYDLTLRKDAKVFRNGPFLIGYTTSFRMGQLLRYKLTVPEQEEGVDVETYLHTTFIESVRTCLKEGGYASKDKDQESGGTFLLGYRGRLFKVGSDYQLGEPQDGFDACGCGESFALGSLYETRQAFCMTAKTRIMHALETAEHFSAGVRGPFLVMAMDEE
ncbi:MAG: hypothetical protein ACRDHE_01235 [Ktedonobacterales bacterium]